MFTLFAARQCRGEAQVFAFEPIPTTFSCSRRTPPPPIGGDYAAAMNARPGASLTVHAINRGLSDSSDEVIFQYHPNFTLWSTQDADFARQRLDRFVSDVAGMIRVLPARLGRLAVRPVVA